jgi:putative N6-adenine-specific DNA methylase
LEPFVVAELEALGIVPRLEVGGASFRGNVETVARVNLWLRTGSRVIVRVASFRAQAFHELERLARAIPWERYLMPADGVRFRVTSKKSRLYHTGAIAQRFGEAIEHRLGRASSFDVAGAEHESERSSTQLFVIRVTHDQFTVSVDSSGALLHQRGYRKAIAKAPLRETLAAALLIATDWLGSATLLDPFCGSGTIPIEAAMLARRMAPGLGRSFSFQSWPTVEEKTWKGVHDEAVNVALAESPVPIRGFDRDAGAIAAAQANAERAGVLGDVEFAVRALSKMSVQKEKTGFVITNPPYGLRVGEAGKLRDLYARFGQVLRERCPGWRLAMLSANARLDAELRLRLEERAQTRNGGIAVRIMTGEVPAAPRVQN